MKQSTKDCKAKRSQTKPLGGIYLRASKTNSSVPLAQLASHLKLVDLRTSWLTLEAPVVQILIQEVFPYQTDYKF